NDPLLQGRLFSYLDTQLSRLGSANFAQLPINAPQCPMAHQQRDGHMQMARPAGRVAYEPNTLSADAPRSDRATGFSSVAINEGGDRGRLRDGSFADHYSQARQFWISQTPPEQAHLASALVFELSKVEHPPIRAAMVSHLLVIDPGLGQRVANGLGMDTLPPPATPAQKVKDLPPSAALSIIGNAKPLLEGRCVGILVHDGSDGAAIAALKKAVLATGARVKIVALKVGGATLADGRKLPADAQLAGAPSVLFDAVALVLSAEAGKALSREAAAVDFVRDAFCHLKAIAADAGAQALLDVAGVMPDAGVLGADDLRAFVEAAATRQWDREPRVCTLA
ncbi:MAG: catalase-related domain-containing protein, partial [Hydrogenophaga sp.]